MKPLKELEYYMHKGEKVYYAKAEDIKSAVELACKNMEHKVENYNLHTVLNSSLIYELEIVMKEAFPALYGKGESLTNPTECEHNNSLGMCRECSIEREICAAKEGVE